MRNQKRTTTTIDDRRILRAAGAVSPLRRGSARAARVATVLRSRTVAQALRRGARRTTVRWCIDRGLIRTPR